MKKIILLILLSLTFKLTYTQVTFQWIHTIEFYGMTWGNGVKVVVDSTNIPLVLGQQYYWEVTPSFHLYKLNSIGTTIWSIQSGRSCEGNFMFLDSMNNIYVAGWEKIGWNNGGPFIAKYSPAGTLQFYKLDSLVTPPVITSAWVDKYGNSYIESSLSNRFRIVKYSAMGALNWNASYGDHDSINKPNAITLDQANNVLASGIVFRYGLTLPLFCRHIEKSYI